MLPIADARLVLDAWNERHPDTQFVPWETVYECLTAFRRWQLAILTRAPPDHVIEHLTRHNEFARRIPDALIAQLTEDDDDDDR